MDQVQERKKQLLEALRGCDEVTRFEKAREAIRGRRDIRERIDRFREQVYTSQNNSSACPEEMLNEMNRLFALREELHKDPLIADYLDSELELCRLLQDICLDVMNVSDLQIGAFERSISV